MTGVDHELPPDSLQQRVSAARQMLGRFEHPTPDAWAHFSAAADFLALLEVEPHLVGYAPFNDGIIDALTIGEGGTAELSTPELGSHLSRQPRLPSTPRPSGPSAALGQGMEGPGYRFGLQGRSPDHEPVVPPAHRPGAGHDDADRASQITPAAGAPESPLREAPQRESSSARDFPRTKGENAVPPAPGGMMGPPSLKAKDADVARALVIIDRLADEILLSERRRGGVSRAFQRARENVGSRPGAFMGNRPGTIQAQAGAEGVSSPPGARDPDADASAQIDIRGRSIRSIPEVPGAGRHVRSEAPIGWRVEEGPDIVRISPPGGGSIPSDTHRKTGVPSSAILLEEVDASTLAELVSRALAEQARINGVDIP